MHPMETGRIFGEIVVTMVMVGALLAWSVYKEVEIWVLRRIGLGARALRVEQQSDRFMRALCGLPEDSPDSSGAWPSCS